MAADGHVKIGTELDSSGIKTGLKSTKTNVKKTFEELARESGKTVEELKEDAKRIAEEYQKQGYNIPLSYKKAYSDMNVYSDKAKRQMKDDADDIGDSHEDNSEKAEKSWKEAFADIGSYAKQGFAAVGNITVAASRVAVTAIAGVGTALGAAAVAGLKYNSTMEDFLADFKVMLGDLETAQGFVNDLKEMSAATPFEMTDLAQASKILLAFGSDAESAIEQIKMLGDISLGNSEKLGTLSTAFGRIQSNGRASMEEINMMIDAGFNPLNIIAEKTGETMQELRDRVSDGKVSFEEIAEAMKVATSEGGQFYQGMEVASHTLSGQISTLKDNALALAGEVVQPVSESLTNEILPSAIEAMDELTESFREKGTEGLIETGTQMAADLAVGIAEAAPQMIETATAIIISFTESLSENMPLILSAGATLLESLITGVLSVGSSLLGLGGQLISSIYDGLILNLPTIMASGAQLVTDLMGGISTMLPMLVENGLALVLELILGIVNNLPLIIDAGIEMILSLVQGIINSLPLLIEKVPLIINKFAETVYATIPKLIAAGFKLIAMLGKGIINAIPTIIANAGEIVKAIFNTISLLNLFNAGSNIIKGMGDGIKNMFPAIKAKVTSLLDLIKNPFKIDWSSIGKNIIDGIAGGIKSGAGKIAEAAKNAAKSALNAAKSFLGIHSPSRVARDVIGKNLIAGVGVGIEDETPKVEKLSQDSMKEVVAGMQENSYTVYPEYRTKDESNGENREKGKPLIDYDKLADKLTERLDGMKIQMDGREMGRFIKEEVIPV